jgi:hypothetical protein
MFWIGGSRVYMFSKMCSEHLLKSDISFCHQVEAYWTSNSQFKKKVGEEIGMCTKINIIQLPSVEWFSEDFKRPEICIIIIIFIDNWLHYSYWDWNVM